MTTANGIFRWSRGAINQSRAASKNLSCTSETCSSERASRRSSACLGLLYRHPGPGNASCSHRRDRGSVPQRWSLLRSQLRVGLRPRPTRWLRRGLWDLVRGRAAIWAPFEGAGATLLLLWPLVTIIRPSNALSCDSGTNKPTVALSRIPRHA